MTIRTHQLRSSFSIAAIMTAATFIVALPLDAHARRFSSSGSNSHSNSHPTSHSEESNSHKILSGVTTTIRHKSGRSENETDEEASPGSDNTPSAAPPSAAETKAAADEKQRQEKLDQLATELKNEAERKQQAEARRKAEQELALKLKQEQIAARKQAQEEEARERIRQKEALERQCVIKPVMSDKEIATCKSVWR